ncbi:MAG: hypothetical protein J7M26_03370, partial [Armatimonadetes bacterium]|nr:hypothetical protein [Armatimonadota bacterium]
ISICNMTRQADAGTDYPRLTVEAVAEFIQLVGATDDLPQAVEFLHEHGVKVNYFKADDADGIRWLLDQGVDFVLTDRLDTGLAVWREWSSE